MNFNYIYVYIPVYIHLINLYRWKWMIDSIVFEYIFHWNTYLFILNRYELTTGLHEMQCKYANYPGDTLRIYQLQMSLFIEKIIMFDWIRGLIITTKTDSTYGQLKRKNYFRNKKPMDNYKILYCSKLI